MKNINRYALKKEYYILKLVGLVLALNVVLILDWSREHLAQAQPIENVTIYNTTSGSFYNAITQDDTVDNASLGGLILTPNASNAGGSIPSNNTVVINGAVDGSVAKNFMGGLNFNGNSENNTVSLKDSANITASVYGGYAVGEYNVINNTVEIKTTGRAASQVIGGYLRNGGTVEKNQVNFINGSVNGVYGGSLSGSGIARDNKVIVNGTGGFVINFTSVYGAYSTSHSSEQQLINNSVTFINSNVTNVYAWASVIGASTSNNDVSVNLSGNSVEFINSSVYSVVGAEAKNGIVSGNIVKFINSSADYVGGGGSATGSTIGNSVTLYNSIVSLDVDGSYGVSSSNVGKQINNSVTLYNTNVSNSVHGSYRQYLGNSSGNNVTLFNNSNAVFVYGSYIGYSGNSSDNNVLLKNSTVSDSVYGSYIIRYGNSSDNNVTLQDSNVTGNVFSSYVNFSNPSTITTIWNVTDNIVDITGGKITGDIYGSYVGTGTSDNTANVSGNKVKLVGTDGVKNIFGGYAANNSVANVSSNLVNVAGGGVSGNITGGRASTGQAFHNMVVIADIDDIENVIGGYSINSSADNNTVNLTNVRVTGDVYGGYSSNTTSDVNFTSNNTVTLAGVEIGGNLIVGNQAGDNNNIIFYSGPRDNLVNGSVNASGELLIVDGSNAINNSTNVGKLNITGGQTNTFKSKVNVTGDISITGGDRNDFLADLYSESGDIIIAAGVNTFSDLIMTNDGKLNITGGQINFFKSKVNVTKDISITGGDNNIFLNDLSSESGDIIIAGGVNTFFNPIMTNDGKLNITGGQTNNFKSKVNVTDGISITGGDNNIFLKELYLESGDIIIAGGVNTFSDLTTNVGKLNITGGQTNNFSSKVNVTGGISITGGVNNIFLDDLYSDGDMVIAGGENKFHNLITQQTNNNITVTGPSVNFYSGNITTQNLSLNGGAHYFVASDQLIETDYDVVATHSEVVLGAETALTLTQSLRISEDSFLRLAGSARLTTTGSTGLGLEGELDLGVHDLRVEGNVTFTSGSTLSINFDGTDQGSLTANDKITLDGEKPIFLALSNSKIDPDSPIIVATTNEALKLTADNFEAPSYIIVNDEIPDEIYIYLKPPDETIDDLDNTTEYKPTDNDKQFVDAIKDQDSLDSFYEAVKEAEDSGNMGILERFMKQSSGETMVGVNIAIENAINKFQGAVYKRLDRIQGNLYAAGPPAAGSEDAFNRLWVGGHGSWASQKSQADFYGYDFQSGGVSLGYDRLVDGIPGLRFGLAASFSTGQIKSLNGWTTIDSDTAGFGVYGSYQLDNDLFFDANVAYALSKNNAKNIGVNGGWKEGDFNMDTWQIGARVGKIFDLRNATLTPTVGLRYMNARQDGWTESVHGTPLALVNVFDKKSIQIVEVPFLLRLNGAFMAGSAKIIPEIRLGWTLVALKPDNKLSVGLVNGGPTRWTVTGIKPASGSFQGGAGVKIEISDFWDVFVNYELEAAKGYMNNSAALGVGFNF